MTKNDGGSAFPLAVAVSTAGDLYDSSQAASGMSLRDWFAGQALAGLMVNDDTSYNAKTDGTVSEWQANVRRDWAKFCYKMADEMIAERDKDTP